MATRRPAAERGGGLLAARGGVVATAVALAVLAAIFWGVFWHQTADSELTRAPLLDEAWYLQEAARLRAEGGAGDAPFVMSPGYPLLVAAAGGRAPVAGVLQAQPRALLGFQALAWLACGLISGAVVLAAGRRAGLADRAALAVGVGSALLFLLYRPAAIYARTILLEVPLTALVAAAVAIALAARPGAVLRAVLVGVCLGLAASLRAHVLVLLVLFVPVIWRAAAAPIRRAAATVLLVVLALLPVALASAHNTRTTGHLTGPSLNAGVNLYLGQQPEAGGLFVTLAGFDLERDPSGAAYLTGRLGRPVADAAEADRIWLAEARARMVASPGRTLASWLRKIWLHLQGWEIAQVTPLSAWPASAPVLHLLPVPWGVLVMLSLVGTTAALVGGRTAGPAADRGPGRQATGWALAVVLLIAVQSVFFVVSRYRLILAPSLAVLAGLGLVAALAPANAREGRRRLVSLAALPVAALLVVPWGLNDVRRSWRGLEDYNQAIRLLTVDGPEDRERADRLLARTCAADGRRSRPWQLRAQNLTRLGRVDEALLTLAEGILRVDDPASLERSRIALVRDLGRLDQAEALSLAYLRDSPGDLDVLHDLAVLQGRRGRWTEAAVTARRVLEAAPEDHRGWLDLAVALAQLDRTGEAVQALRDGLGRVPPGPGRELLAENLRRLERRLGGG